MTKEFLENKNVNFTSLYVDELGDEFKALDALTTATGQKTVPFVYIGEQFIGGLSDLKEHEQKGDLDFLIKELKNQKQNEKIVW